MSQHSFSIPNESGLLFRQDVNNALQALAQLNSGATEPSTIYPLMMWSDTSGATPVLKVRNVANTAWIIIGDLSVANLGLLLKSGGTLTGAINFTNNDYTTLPVGTTAQRPSSPSAGMIRFNSTINSYEGFNNSSWAPIGGISNTITVNSTLSANATITIDSNKGLQTFLISGASAEITLSSTPFGTSPPPDGSLIYLVGNSDVNTVTIPFNDAANGCLMDGDKKIAKGQVAGFMYSSSLARYVRL